MTYSSSGAQLAVQVDSPECPGWLQRPPAIEWLARLRWLEPLDLGAPTADLVQADRAARDLEPFPEQRQP